LADVVTEIGMSPGGSQLLQGIYAAIGADQDKFDRVIFEIDPTALSLSGVFAQNAVSSFNRTTFDRLRYLQDNPLGNKLYGNNYRGQSPCEPAGYSCGETSSQTCGSVSGGGLIESVGNLWFQSVGNWSNQSFNGVNGYSSDTFGFSLGLDNRISRSTILGIGLGGSFTNAKMKENLGNAGADSFLLSLYGSHELASNFFLNGSLGYLYSDLDSHRVSPTLGMFGAYADSERHANALFGNLELSYRIGNKWSYLTPFLGYDYLNFSESAYTESGQIMNMKISGSTVTGHLQTLGMRFGGQYRNSLGWLINPQLTAGWLHDYGAGRTHTTDQFSAGGPTFTVLGVSRHKNRGLLSANINAAVSQQTSLFVRYDGEFANHFNSQFVSGGISYSF
jgi:outer membrane autotransporter protein